MVVKVHRQEFGIKILSTEEGNQATWNYKISADQFNINFNTLSVQIIIDLFSQYNECL